MEAGSVGIGSSIVSRAGPALAVTALTWQKNKAEELAAGTGSSFGGYTVYNMTVEDDHTFFVGMSGGGTWVHNACPYAGDKFPGVSPRQGLHSPLKAPKTPYHNFPAQNPAKTALDPAHFPGKTVEDVLRDAWNNPTPGGSVDPNTGDFTADVGYPVNASGTTTLQLRVGGDGVHGWPK